MKAITFTDAPGLGAVGCVLVEVDGVEVGVITATPVRVREGQTENRPASVAEALTAAGYTAAELVREFYPKSNSFASIGKKPFTVKIDGFGGRVLPYRAPGRPRLGEPRSKSVRPSFTAAEWQALAEAAGSEAKVAEYVRAATLAALASK